MPSKVKFEGVVMEGDVSEGAAAAGGGGGVKLEIV